ncbi:MAG: HAD-IIA family hydrolase [Desulfovibrionaceae bacterium]|nr:HAD-IIA family hydrolase [Desulfovibrionaceae bacterium]
MDWSLKRCIVLDMDGTVYLGHIPIEGAVAFIRQHWEKLDFYFLSNNTSKSPQSYVDKLNGMGIPATLERLLSPVTPLVDFLRARGIHTAYAVGNTDFQQDLLARMPELTLAEDGAQAVILAYDTELTYHKLARSALLLQQPDVLFLATHPDLVCPSPEGPLPDVGSMIELYATATGRRPQYIFGKPDPTVLAPLLARYAREEMVMVGDRLSTDKKLAENANIDFVLVLSGEARREDLQHEVRQPALILEDLGQANAAV